MFSPYHQFRDCSRLEECIAHLDQGSTVPPDILAQYHRYHNALLYKLRCARYYVDRLDDALTNANPANIVDDADEFRFTINRFIDGFLYSGGSALDILAREVLTYFGITLPDIVYFSTARNELQQHRPGDPILPRLDEPTWKEQFLDYRNSQTHELLLGVKFDISVTGYGADDEEQEIVFPLPDNPRDPLESRTYHNNPDALQYCKCQLIRLLRLVHQTYTHVADRIDAAGSLPL